MGSPITPPPGIELYFTRHAKSMENDGRYLVVDSPLSTEGRVQSLTLSGHFDYIIASPMRRCIETLHYSGITYGSLIIDHNFRERVYVDSSRMLLEKGIAWESDDSFWQRVQQFQANLVSLLNIWSSPGTVKRVLLIGHSYFFRKWTGRSFLSSVDNASIFRLA